MKHFRYYLMLVTLAILPFTFGLKPSVADGIWYVTVTRHAYVISTHSGGLVSVGGSGSSVTESDSRSGGADGGANE